MKKNSFKVSLNEIHRLAEIIPKTVNEAINFQEDKEMPDDYGQNMPEEEMGEMHHENRMDMQDAPAGPEEQEMNSAGKELVDKIRKVSLQGMADLADSPDTPEYDILKKIWQICDKAIVEKEKEKAEAQVK